MSARYWLTHQPENTERPLVLAPSTEEMPPDHCWFIQRHRNELHLTYNSIMGLKTRFKSPPESIYSVRRIVWNACPCKHFSEWAPGGCAPSGQWAGFAVWHDYLNLYRNWVTRREELEHLQRELISIDGAIVLEHLIDSLEDDYEIIVTKAVLDVLHELVPVELDAPHMTLKWPPRRRRTRKSAGGAK